MWEEWNEKEQAISKWYKQRSMYRGSAGHRHVEEAAMEEAREFWHTGKVNRWQSGAREEGNAERWNRSRTWKGDCQRNGWSSQEKTRAGCALSFLSESQDVVMGARRSLSVDCLVQGEWKQASSSKKESD